MAPANVTLRHRVAIESDIGRMRRTNQDSAGSDEETGLYVVCDGMGGPAGGEIAGRIATETFLEIGRTELAASNGSPATTEAGLRRAVAAANRAVRARADFDTRFRGMGTTLVGCRLWGTALTLINVGDSRAYLVRDGSAACLTVDHSYVSEQVRRGMMTQREASSSSLKSVITRAVGVAQDVSPDVFHQEVRGGDAVLLTSDGLTRHVEDEEIGAMVRDGLRDGPAEICRRLIACANQRGGSDNITCLLLCFSDDEPEGEKPA
jgi:PPM family protein phosphatase